jgi:membrane protease YdiL (CAAX protease family)
MVAVAPGAPRQISFLRRVLLGHDPVLLMARKGRWQWPWAVAGIVLMGLVFALLGGIAAKIIASLANAGWQIDVDDSVFPINPAQPLSYLNMVLVTLPFMLAPLIVLPLFHRVSWRSAFSFGVGFQWKQFLVTAAALTTVSVATLAISYALDPAPYTFPALAPNYVLMAGLALGVVFVQSFGEEVFFRGYLLRTVGAALPFRLPVTAAIITLFVSGHLGNEDLEQDFAFNIIYFVIIEVLAYALLFRTQNLAASAGIHWTNNVSALLAPTVPGQPTALAMIVYNDPVYAAGDTRLFDLGTHLAGVAGIATLIVLLYWRRSPFFIAKAPLPEVDPPASFEPSPPARS